MQIKSIKCIENRMFYDSTWEVEFADGTICKIVRDDMETEHELRRDVERCKGIDDVKQLDMRNRIYYD